MKKTKILSFLGVAVAAVLTLFSCGKKEVKDLTYSEFVAAPLDSNVVVKSYVQDNESWWDGKITLYLQDKDGAILAYNTICTKEQANEITKGVCVRVEGKKVEWSGEVEISDANLTILKDEEKYVAQATDLTNGFSNETVKTNHPNQLFKVKGKVQAKLDKDNNPRSYFNNWDNSGQVDACDTYFDIKVGDNKFTFNVRRYLRGSDTVVYKASRELVIGFEYEFTAYAYIYNNEVQARVIGIKQITEGVDVEIDYKDGSQLKVVTIEKNTKFARPEDPTRPSDETYDYQFAGWYTDPAYLATYDFDTNVTESMRIFAKWNKVKKTA